MNDRLSHRRPLARLALLLLTGSALATANAATTPAAGNGEAFAPALQATYAKAGERLRDNPFGRPLYIDSSEADGRLSGSVHARLDQPFELVRGNLRDPADWCRMLLLMPNIASCQERREKGAPGLSVGLVKKSTDKPDAAMPVRFSFDVQQSDDGLQARMRAPDGPLGTHDYRISVQAVPVADGKTFLYLRYAYAYGWTANLAAKTYLSTSGADKIGFSSSGGDGNGKPQHIGGLRGAVERNAMRCYLAIESYLGTSTTADDGRFDASLQRWVKAIGDYPAQLAEDDIKAYVAAKQRDGALQRKPVAGSGS